MDSFCNCFTNNAGNFVNSGAFGSTAGTTFGSSGIFNSFMFALGEYHVLV